MPWIIDDVEEKIQEALGMGHLSCIYIAYLNSTSWVANDYLDVLPCYDLQEHGLDKLRLNNFSSECEPFSEEVFSRLGNMCPHLTTLQLSDMRHLT